MAARPVGLTAEDRAAWRVTRGLANGKATVTQRACGLCSATLPLCAQLRRANSAQISEEAAMSENAEQKKKQAKLSQDSTPIPVFQKKSVKEVAALQPDERDPRVLHAKLHKRALKLELGEGNSAPALM
jgi:hypothetical protein